MELEKKKNGDQGTDRRPPKNLLKFFYPVAILIEKVLIFTEKFLLHSI